MNALNKHPLFVVAQADHQSMVVLMQSEVPFAMACFHAQQAVEKYIKAVLTIKNAKYRYTHDLYELCCVAADNNIMVPLTQDQALRLNPYAVSERYDLPPQYNITKDELQQIVDLIANWCQKQLHD